MAHTSWHFDLGNSSRGTIGASGRVCATSKKEAVEQVRQLVERYPLGAEDIDYEEFGKHAYLEVYFNPDKITARHLNDPGPCTCYYEEDAHEHAHEAGSDTLVAAAEME